MRTRSAAGILKVICQAARKSALGRRARFAIEEWTLDGARLVEVLGRVHLLEMAHQAFVAAKQMRPAGRLTLRRRAQVLREWLPKPP
jgi:hypothetical protein